MRNVHNLFLANTAPSKQKHEDIHEKNSWFKDTFLDSKRNLKEEIHEELKRQVPFISVFDQCRKLDKTIAIFYYVIEAVFALQISAGIFQAFLIV